MSNLKVIQLLPELNIGGVERGVCDLSKELVKRNHESFVISNGGELEKNIINSGGNHINLPVHKKSITSFFLSKKLAEAYNEIKPDIIHIRSRIPAWINYFAMTMINFKKPILISTFHGLYSKPFYSKIMAKTDHTIAISETVLDYIVKNYNIKKEKISLIHRGCDHNTFYKKDIEESWLKKWYEDFPETKEKIILTLPGRVSRWKGHESFIKLIASLENSYHGLIVGPTARNKNKYINELTELTKKYDIEKNITFVGKRSDIENIYRLSDVVYNLSSKPEPFGRTTIEAIAVGSKVVGWNHGGTGEILSELFCEGLVELNNKEDLKNTTISVANSKNLPLKNTFTSEKMINKTINLYEQISLNE